MRFHAEQSNGPPFLFGYFPLSEYFLFNLVYSVDMNFPFGRNEFLSVRFIVYVIFIERNTRKVIRVDRVPTLYSKITKIVVYVLLDPAEIFFFSHVTAVRSVPI